MNGEDFPGAEFPGERELLGELARALETTDPVPREWLAAGMAVPGEVSIADGEPELRLCYDSATDGAPAGMRGTAERCLEFSRAPWRMTVQLARTGTRLLRVVGTLTPAEPATVLVLRRPGARVPLSLADGGFFEVDGVPAGPLRLELASGTSMAATPWFVQ
jgi:hypothetical protein